MTQARKPIGTVTFNGDNMDANEYGNLQRYFFASQDPRGSQGSA